jgi:DNA-binding MarR family transcriptional regulator
MTPTSTAAGQHPRHGLDEVIHAPVRFSIMATLSTVDRAEFSFVRDTVEISDSVLSKQVSTLEQAGYVKVTKGYVGKRPRTWLGLSRKGRQAYAAHLAALTEIASLSQPTPEREPAPPSQDQS